VKSKTGFQLPPDVSFEKQRLSNAWAYDIEALAERYENPDFWRRSLQEADDDGPAY
jgi:hypothetical protein